MNTPSLQKHLDKAPALSYYCHIAKQLNSLLKDPELYKFPAEIFELLLWIITTKQNPELEITPRSFTRWPTLAVTADGWWVYDIELRKDGIAFCVTRTQVSYVAKTLSLGNLKRCFGRAFDEVNVYDNLTSNELTNLIDDARAVYYKTRRSRS